MRLITWNCNMAFRKKYQAILDLNPDILIVPECENQEKLEIGRLTPEPSDFLHIGENIHKGLGIFSFSDYSFKILDWYNPDFKNIVPILVSKGIHSFNLFAIWANNPRDKGNQYIEQVWKAINYYEKYLNESNTMLIGDFNSNVIWDRKHEEGNHSAVVKRLEQHGIHSCYHTHFNEHQGRESQPTLYMYRHQDKPYHIDYCFASKNLLDGLSEVQVGKYPEWIQLSDHMPVIVDINLPPN